LLVDDVTLIKTEVITAHVRLRGGDTRTLRLDRPVPIADSDDAGRAFRLMSATCSDRSRPAVPIEVGRGGGSPAGLM
jgi:hypothetical protein